MRTHIFGCPIDILTMSETIDLARSAMRRRKTTLHVAMNVAKLVNMRTDLVLAEDVKNSDIIGIDGMGILLAAKLSGLPAKERVAGIDLLQELLAVCANEGFRPFFLGARSRVVLKAHDAVTAKHPSIRFAGTRDGYFAADREEKSWKKSAIAEQIVYSLQCRTPRKERFLSAYRDQLRVPFIMGVGGSFDVLAGEVMRAPALMQRFGLEWVYRIYQEPGRMWWRYFRTNTIFAGMMCLAVVKRLKSKVAFI